MTTFVTIMRFNDGLASYLVDEEADGYRASLLRSTSGTSLPSEIRLANGFNEEVVCQDIVMRKLVHAIRLAESDQD